MSSGSTEGPAAGAGLAAPAERRGAPPDGRAVLDGPLPAEPAAPEPTGVGPAGRRAAPERAWSRPVWASRTADEIDGDRTGSPSRRWVRWSAVALAVVVLVAAVAGAENHGRRRLRDAVAEQLRSSGITGTIDVSVPGGPVPVVLPALFGRGLSELEIRIRDGQVAGLPVARADYVLTDLQGDVSLRTGQVHVRSIGGGDVRIEVAPSALADSIGTELVIRDGRLRAGPDELLVDTEVVGDALVLSGPAESLWGAPIEVPIADGYLLPCTPEVSIRRSVVVLSCRGSKLPGVLRAPLGIDSRGGSDVAPVGSLVPPASTVVAGPGTATTTEDPVTTTIAPTTIAPTETVPVVTVAPPVEPVPAPAAPPAPG